MAIGLFKKPYILRRHGEQTVVNGYASAAYADMTVRLNVQPQPPDRFEGREEGDAVVKHLKSWGSARLTAADEINGIPGDCLYYNGVWFECKSSVMWDHTLLAHYQSDFVILPADKQFPPPSESDVTE